MCVIPFYYTSEGIWILFEPTPFDTPSLPINSGSSAPSTSAECESKPLFLGLIYG
jgi:hypothetical protein